MKRFLLYFPMGLDHCVNAATHKECAVIISFIISLNPCDGEGSFVSKDGTRESIRDPRGAGVCVVDKCVGSTSWCLLVPAGVVTCRD